MRIPASPERGRSVADATRLATYIVYSGSVGGPTPLMGIFPVPASPCLAEEAAGVAHANEQHEKNSCRSFGHDDTPGFFASVT